MITEAGLVSDNAVTESAFAQTVQVYAAKGRPIGGASKRAIDISLALSALLVILPLMVIVAALIWHHDRQSPFFGHKRIGRNGRTFRCWKFRSMLPDAAAVLARHLAEDPEAAREWAETQKLRNDPRVTPIGRVLRLSSLDELPQLFNVLAGHMSIVGPRPIVADEVGRYGAHFDHYTVCRPGLTGLWQVSGRSDTSYAERVRYDTQYVQNWSLWRDAVIVARTVPVLLHRQGSY